MKLDFYKPKNNILKQYIEGYYFISEDENSKSIKYFTFPNNFCIVSVSQNAKIKIEEKQIFISNSAEKNIIANSVSRYSEPLEIIYQNAVNEITVYFKPLGINNFINEKNIFEQTKIADFIPFHDFKKEMEVIFSQQNRETQIELLENYWLSKFEKKDLGLVTQILSDIETDLKIEEIAKKHNLTRQYISKLFLRKIGKTPSEYRKIFRFRKSINEVRKSKNLTQLSHGNLFYDQSHFIKDFKALAKINPSLFFKNVDTEKENVWLYI